MEANGCNFTVLLYHYIGSMIQYNDIVAQFQNECWCPAGRPKAVHRPEFKRYRSEFFCETPNIYVDVHLG